MSGTKMTGAPRRLLYAWKHHIPGIMFDRAETETIQNSMIKRIWILLICAIAAPGLYAAEKPNIIIVMPDDMGYGDMGVTGNKVIRTPNLDRLASESAELTDFYVSPVCSPTRACLMTGRYNYRTRVIDTFKGRSMMDPNEVTIAEALKPAGYTSGIFGKWHLGDNHPMRPQEQGFDDVMIHRGGGLAQPSEAIANKRRYTDPILYRNGKEVQTEGYCTDVYFDAAMDFMKNAAAENKPFFAYIPPNAPHGPYHDVPEDLLNYYKSIDLTPILGKNTSDQHKDTVARVFAMIENIDHNMGRLDQFLKKNDLMDNTLVMFFLDNGPNTMRYVGPFRGMKSNVHEGGIRSCFYARWPAKLKPGHKSDRIAAHIDIMPTLIDIAGVNPPSGVAFDGISVLPLLTSNPGGWNDRTLFIQTHRGDQPVPEHHIGVRSQHWKLVHPTGFGTEQMPDNVPFELYQIMKDPGETTNLATEYPEQLAKMRRAYASWLADVSMTRPDNYAPPRIDIGVPSEPIADLSIQDWRVPKNATGWGDGGTWFVNVKEHGPYSIELQFDTAPGARYMEVHVGDQKFPLEIEDGKTSVTIDNVELQTGKSTVRVNSKPHFKRGTYPRFVTFHHNNQ